VKIKKEFKVGFLVSSSLIILYLGIKFLKGSDVFNPAGTYFARYENVDGLMPSNPIFLHGFQVGLVRKIRVNQSRQNQVLVEMEIDKDILIGDSAVATLSNNGFLGGKMIVLHTGKAGTERKTDTLLSEVAPGLTSMIEDRAQPMVDRATRLVDNVDILVKTFQPTAEKLNLTLDAITRLSNTGNTVVGNSQADLKNITANLEKLSAALLESEKQLRTIMAKVNTLGDSLNKAEIAGTLKALHRTTEQLNQTLSGINEGRGTAGKLIKNDSLYQNLNASSASLNALLKDLKANPKRYIHFSVFGQKDPKEKKVKTKP
jgi:phospholipid/cholesterol/gamma-HCH transport system substrate-binding protein